MNLRTPASSGMAERRGIILAVCCLSIFLVAVDMTAVNVALPFIREEFSAGPGELSWTIDAYSLTLAALLMFSASMADRIGRKRVFMLGLSVFILGSALCAFAPTLPWLIAFRILQAVGGSAMNPVAMSIISVTFTQPKERARALGVWASVTGLALAVGPLLGGLLIDSGWGWRWIFAINIPIGILAVLAAGVIMRESKAPHARRFDPVGQILVMLFLLGLTFGTIEGGRLGWGDPLVLAAYLLSLLALAGILLYEPRRQEPMLELRFFRSVPFSGANLIAIAAFAALGSFLFMNSLYLQEARGFSALQTGLLLTPLAVASLLFGPVNGRLLGRFGPRPSLLIAGSCYVLAALLLSTISTTTPVPLLLFAYALLGLANSAVSAPITSLAVAGMPAAQAGLASGTSSASRQVGTTLGVALAGVVLGSTSSGDDPQALAAASHTGWALVIGYGVVVLALGVLVTTSWAKATAARAFTAPGSSEQF